jgi:hypothetical protein
LTGDEVYELLSSASRRRASLGNVHHRQPDSVMGRTPLSHTTKSSRT